MDVLPMIMNGNISQLSCGDGNYFIHFFHSRIFVVKGKEIEFTRKGLGYLS